MTIRRQTRKRQPRNFTVVARGARRTEPDISRIVKAALDHYRANSSQSDRVITERSSSSVPGDPS